MNNYVNSLKFADQIAASLSEPVQAKKDGICLFEVPLNFSAAQVAFIKEILKYGGFDFNPRINDRVSDIKGLKKSEVRKLIADINQVVRESFDKLRLPKDFSLVKIDSSFAIISEASVKDLEQKLYKARAREKAAAEITQATELPPLRVEPEVVQDIVASSAKEDILEEKCVEIPPLQDKTINYENENIQNNGSSPHSWNSTSYLRSLLAMPAIRVENGVLLVYGYPLALKPEPFAFVEKLHNEGSFATLFLPAKDNSAKVTQDLRMRSQFLSFIAEINREARRCMQELELPTNFGIIRIRVNQVVFSQVELRIIERKIKKRLVEIVKAQIERTKKPVLEVTLESVKVKDNVVHEDGPPLHPDPTGMSNEVEKEKKGTLEKSCARQVNHSLARAASKKIWAPIAERAKSQIQQYEKKNKFPDSWGATPNKVGKYLLLLINKMMEEGQDTMRGLPDTEKKEFCARAAGAKTWLDIERAEQRPLLAALNALTLFDSGGSLRPVSHELNGTFVKPAAVMSLS